MKNMKKLASSIIFSFFAVVAVGCGSQSSILNPPKTTAKAGVYLIPATTNYQLPQAIILTNFDVRLGTESDDVISIENVQSLGDESIKVSLKYTGTPEIFSVTARRLPLSENEYETASADRPFLGLYASKGGTIICAISTDSAVIMEAKTWTSAADIIEWTRKKASVKMNTLNSDLKLMIAGDMEIRCNPLTPDSPPYKTGVAQYFPPTGNSSTEQLIGLDGLGR